VLAHDSTKLIEVRHEVYRVGCCQQIEPSTDELATETQRTQRKKSRLSPCPPCLCGYFSPRDCANGGFASRSQLLAAANAQNLIIPPSKGHRLSVIEVRSARRSKNRLRQKNIRGQRSAKRVSSKKCCAPRSPTRSADEYVEDACRLSRRLFGI
jgi:hypothetical protein